MKHEDNIRQLKSEHDSIEAVLPWYINGTLPLEECHQVEKHMETCLQCRAAMTELQNMQRAVQQSTDVALVERNNLQDVLSRIDKASSTASVARKQQYLSPQKLSSRWSIKQWLTNKVSHYWRVFMALPGGWRYTVVAQSLLLVLAGVMFTPSTEPVFTTLSASSAENSKQDNIRMRVVFAEDVLFRDIRHLLVNAKARIVDGPTPSGVYTLETIYAPDEVLQDVLDRWRAKALVRFVEPVSNIVVRN
ncbi:MAG: zf-HC2 domain-containing protein [Gammaproteobacteria bacterium]|nr:zf-HC2 domain-containing protein [Gammaproteobacteria bacterium]